MAAGSVILGDAEVDSTMWLEITPGSVAEIKLKNIVCR
jgi:hypothetical protein